MRPRPVRSALIAATALLLSTVAAAPAAALDLPLLPSGPDGTYAPLDRRGPALSVPGADLAASLTCSGPLTGLTRDPVLLVPGTTMDPQVGFSWNYMKAFDADGITWCAVTLPHDATGDVQVAGEYLVNGIRTMSKASKRKVDVVGWSQGGMVPRWALRFWPDTRAMVDDLVGLSPSNHGTTVADVACQDTCTPANWQQRSISTFMDALNSGAETFPGISYTQAYTQLDEIVVPNIGPNASSALKTGSGAISNVALQSVCPTNTADHFAIGSFDAVAYAITKDALDNPGPAVPLRISPTTCLEPFMPGVDPTTFATDYLAFLRFATSSEGDAAKTASEPALKPYVFAKR
ncbi:MAG: Lipase [Frankiales bacterium]|jgi:hypothetical protein|nr:Lipase [Frankiales bacterium]